MSEKKRIIMLGFHSPVDAKLMREWLTGLDYEVVESLDDTDGIDLVLMDSATARRLMDKAFGLKRAAKYFLPVLVCINADEDVGRWLKAGFDDVLHLPATKEEWRARIDIMLRLRRQSEELGRKSETSLIYTLENMSDGFVSLDESWHYIYVNKKAGEMLGRKPEDLVGKHIWTEFPEGIGQPFYKNYYKAVETQKAICFEDYYPPWDRWFENRVFPSKKDLSIFFQDITERKQAEKELALSEQRYRSIVEDSPHLISTFLPGGEILFVNQAYCEYFGKTPEELIGATFLTLIPEEDREKVMANISALTRESPTVSHEHRVIKDDGTIGWDRWTNRAICDAQGNVVNYQSIGEDVTDRKRTEEKLKESEARLRSVFEASPLGIGLIQDRKMLWHNKTMAQLLGYFSEELHGESAKMLYESAEEFERVGDTIKSLGPGKRTTDIETRWVRKDGSTLDCHIRYALLNPESKDSAILAMVDDITERKKAEEEKRKLEAQLNQAQKMEAIGVLAGGVAHDFNNILTAIIGNAELVLMDLGKNSSSYGNIKEIRKAGHRAAALTRQLLAFSRKELIRPEVMDLKSLTMNLEKMLKRLIGEDIELATVYAPDLWQVEADPGQMEQIIMNLVVNARDAMPKGGKLTIETANVELDERYLRDHGVENETGPYVMLAVTDTGTGMDKETQARIFDPFFTTKELGRGTGLGLSTVYGIVKQNNGYIWVYSEEGAGTTFKVYLPRADAETEGVEKEQSAERSLGGSETILVAEDDDALLKMARKVLEGYGYRALTAQNGKEALEIAASHDGPLHLLLTDVVMPAMSGAELAEQMKTRVPGIKVLYMSGYTDNAIAHHGVLEKDVDFIQKPFTREGLAGKVREVLGTEI